MRVLTSSVHWTKTGIVQLGVCGLVVWWSGPPDFDTQMKLRDHFDTQIKSGGLVVWWSKF